MNNYFPFSVQEYENFCCRVIEKLKKNIIIFFNKNGRKRHRRKYLG